jgi:hypothetical protein
MAKTVVNSKYSILSNKPLTKDFTGAWYEISYLLPTWFTSWNGEKIIKVYGCSFAYLESKNKEPILSSKYANQFISVHSNIARNDTTLMNSVYTLENGLPGPKAEHDELTSINEYMMVVNNYYTPKIYNLTNSTLDRISISFRDSHGSLICIRTPYSSDPSVGEAGPGFLDEIYQAVFKIECELAILSSPL